MTAQSPFWKRIGNGCNRSALASLEGGGAEIITSPLATRAMKKVHPALLLSFVLAHGASAVTAQERFSPYVPSDQGNVECTSWSGLAFIHVK